MAWGGGLMIKKMGTMTVILYAALMLGACATSPASIGRSTYSYDASSQLTEGDLSGHSYAFYVFSEASSIDANENEIGPILAELEDQLAARGYNYIDDIEEADFILYVSAGYAQTSSYRDRPVYAPGERHEIEIERDVPRYDSRGRYIGTRTQRERVYYRSPRVQTGVQRVHTIGSYPNISLGIHENQIRVPVSLTPISAPGKDPVDTPVVYYGQSIVFDSQSSLLSVSRCLIENLVDSFPASIQPSTVRHYDQQHCALDVPQPSGQPVLDAAPSPKESNSP